MLETAKQYALEILNALEVCVSKDILADMIVCDWKINSGCEYDNQCCDPVSCCNEVQFEVPVIECNISVLLEDTIYNGEPKTCNITITEL